MWRGRGGLKEDTGRCSSNGISSNGIGIIVQDEERIQIAFGATNRLVCVYT